jgi:hypothetical protein
VCGRYTCLSGGVIGTRRIFDAENTGQINVSSHFPNIRLIDQPLQIPPYAVLPYRAAKPRRSSVTNSTATGWSFDDINGLRRYPRTSPRPIGSLAEVIGEYGRAMVARRINELSAQTEPVWSTYTTATGVPRARALAIILSSNVTRVAPMRWAIAILTASGVLRVRSRRRRNASAAVTSAALISVR